ncbi:MAG: hypothetical protein RJA36_2786 [Pseudomonadota bacterium]|jgi:diguanylate cyclase (GGDEF)-like protein/PAS domain S-box-containing protein
MVAINRTSSGLRALAWGLAACAGTAQAAQLGWAGGELAAAPVLLVALVAPALLWRQGKRLRSEAMARRQADAACHQTAARLDAAQQQVAEALRSGEEKLLLLFAQAHDAMLLIAPDGRILRANDKACAMLGYDRSELEHMAATGLVWPEDAAGLPQLLEGGTGQAPRELRWRHRQGQAVDGQLSVILLRDAQGRPEGAIAQIRDIGELQRLGQELHASEQRFRCVVEGARDMVYTLDLDGRLRYISPRSQDMLGSDPSRFLGQSYVRLLHPDDLPVCQVFLERALASRSRQCGVEYRVRHADGEWRWHSSDLAPLLDAAGRLAGLMGVAHDISAREQNDERIFHMAHFDALTDLPSRRLFDDRLVQALQLAERHGGRVALMHVDLDHFRSVNERWGPAVGDLVLREVASRIKASLRASDSVGRIGGDDFVVLLNEAGTEPVALQVAEKIRQALDEPFMVCGHRIALGGCVGVALCPDHGLEAAELSLHAELALRHAKASGRDNVKVFRPALLADGEPGRSGLLAAA